MVGVGRDLCGSSSPTPLPKQGRLQKAAEDFVQAGLAYLQKGRLHNPSGQPVPNGNYFETVGQLLIFVLSDLHYTHTTCSHIMLQCDTSCDN